jgi:ankyrin repeat protein
VEAADSALTADEAAAAAAAENGWGSLLLAHGVQLDAPSPAGWTALYLAVQEGLQADAAWLLKGGARADAPAADGATPLQVACQAHQPAMVRMLLQHGSDPKGAARSSNCLYADPPPLHVVCSGPLWPVEPPMAMARALLDARADPSQADGLGVSPLHLLAGAAAPSSGADAGGGEPSSLAQYFDARDCGEGSIRLAEGTGGAGFGVGSDDEGRAQLAVRRLPAPLPRRARAPRKCPSSPPSGLSSRRLTSLSPFWMPPVATPPTPARLLPSLLRSQSLLLSSGASVDAADGDEHTAAWLAAFHGRHQLLQTLLDAGASPDLADARGVTPLWAACAAGQPKCAALLLGRGAAAGATDRSACPLLCVAAQVGASQTRGMGKG